MATRRCLQSLTRHHASILSSHQSLKPLNPNHLFQQTLTLPPFLSHQISTPISFHISSTFIPICHTPFRANRFFCSNQGNDSHDEDEATEVQEEGSSDDEGVSSSNPNKSLEEREIEAAEIGYKVVGPLQRSDKVFKPYEPVFAIIQIGSHQFKVSNGDSIFLERLKYCEVNDKLILNKVLMLGSSTQTIIGRPILPDAAVHAVVEEHALDAKVIIFKKKRRKNYRRTKGHRQELTKLRITDIQGIPKPENTASKGKEADAKKEEKVAVLA